MTETSEIELNELIKELENHPTNLDLINSIAIGYFENPSMLIDNDDLKHFELAYNTQKTVKSTHNLAWCLYFEWGDETRAIQIQKECIQLNPNSYYPYYQYGYMLLDQKEYSEAIQYLEKANNIVSKREIVHNLGYCHFQLEDFDKALKLFESSAVTGDIENRSLFNLGLTAFKTSQSDQLKSIAKKLFTEIETNVHKTVSGYEIGLLFYLLKDYQFASACLLKQGIDGIDLFDWKELSYSLYSTDKETWQNKINQGIDERLEWIKEIESGHEDWEDYSEGEKNERLIELSSEIELRKKTISEGMKKPNIDLSESLWVEYCGCLLFDCKRHGNMKNDK